MMDGTNDLLIIVEENESLYTDDESHFEQDSRKATMTSHDISFNNSNSTMVHTSSVLPTSPCSKFQSTQNTYSIQNTLHPYSQSALHAQYGSIGDIESSVNPLRRTKTWIGHSIGKLRSASLSISMLAKPSDDRKATSYLAGWNVTNLIQGTTILGVPYSIQQGGWVGIAMIIILGFISAYTGKLIVECMYESSKKTGIRRRLRTNFPEVAHAAMGKKGLILLNIIQNSVMFGGAIMFLILLGTVWADLFKSFPQLGIKEWACLNCLIAVPLMFITKMSIISWFSMLSVFSIMIAFVTFITFSLTQIHAWDTANIPPFDIETFPIAFGMILFSFCAHPVLPNIEGSMKNPLSYKSMVDVSFSVASISKALLGALMVMLFGRNTCEVITVNLHGYGWVYELTSVLVIINVLLAMPIEMYILGVSYDDLLLKYFPYINKSSGYHWVWLLISRPLLLAVTLLFAVTVPQFGAMMGLVGSVSGTSLSLIFPCYCHLKLRWDVLKWWQIIIDVVLITFGTFAGGVGLFFSVRSMIK